MLVDDFSFRHETVVPETSQTAMVTVAHLAFLIKNDPRNATDGNGTRQGDVRYATKT